MSFEKHEGKRINIAIVDDKKDLLTLYGRVFERTDIGVYLVKHPEYSIIDIGQAVNGVVSDGQYRGDSDVIDDVINHAELGYDGKVPIMLCSADIYLVKKYQVEHGIPGITKPFSPKDLVAMVNKYASEIPVEPLKTSGVMSF